MRTQRHRFATREFRIDQPLRSCIEHLATRCSMDCCGIAACDVTPLMLKLWSDSVGAKTLAAITQAGDVIRLCDDSGGEALSCEFLSYRELCEPASREDADRGDLEKVQDENRRQLRDFFASLVDGLRAHA